jgi:hypothetical protein
MTDTCHSESITDEEIQAQPRLSLQRLLVMQ